jgi:hypothetical protein
MPSNRSTRPSARSRPGKAPSAGAGSSTLDGVTDPVELAKLTLQAICRDNEAPAAARAQSARTLLELAGALKSGVDNATKSAVEMSANEIDERLAALAAQTPDTASRA